MGADQMMWFLCFDAKKMRNLEDAAAAAVIVQSELCLFTVKKRRRRTKTQSSVEEDCGGLFHHTYVLASVTLASHHKHSSGMSFIGRTH